MNVKALSDRAKHRLKVAAALLRSAGHGKALDCPRDQFYEKIQEVISGLAESKQIELKALVDWVESYDKATAALPSPSEKSRK